MPGDRTRALQYARRTKWRGIISAFESSTAAMKMNDAIRNRINELAWIIEVIGTRRKTELKRGGHPIVPSRKRHLMVIDTGPVRLHG